MSDTLRMLTQSRCDAYDASQAFLERLARQNKSLMSFPRPMEEIAKQCGLFVTIASEHIPLKHGCLVQEDILLSPQTKVWQRRLTIGHELGHFELGPSATEYECNVFGVGILSPKEDVMEELKRTIGTKSCTPEGWAENEVHFRTMTTLVRRYHIGYKALLIALADYGFVQGIDPWLGTQYGNALMDEYMKHWQRLKGEDDAASH